MIGPRRSLGFTLIEILVVLVIMGLLAGLVTAVVQPDQRALLRVEAERLAQLLDLAGIEASTSGRPIAWIAGPSIYRFWRYGDGTGWREIHDSDLLRARTLPKGMTIESLMVETMPVEDVMRLEFNPHGATLAYEIRMTFDAERYTITGSPVGVVQALPGNGVPDG